MNLDFHHEVVKACLLDAMPVLVVHGRTT